MKKKKKCILLNLFQSISIQASSSNTLNYSLILETSLKKKIKTQKI
jgi:hypothetical protein